MREEKKSNVTLENAKQFFSKGKEREVNIFKLAIQVAEGIKTKVY